MARKSSKTAHVMNLLAGDTPSSDQESSKTEAAKENMAASLAADSPETIKELTVLAQQASIQTKEEPIRPSPISIIDMTSTVPDPVAELIKQELEQELSEDSNTVKAGQMEEVEGPPQDDPAAESASSEQEVLQSGPGSETSPPEQASPQTGFSSESSSTEQGAPQSDAPVNGISSVQPEPVSVQKKEEEPEPAADFDYLNVMEFVVKGMAEDYIKKFDVCGCGHCRADVTALTLSNLPPKYIVVQSSTASPLLNFYASRLAPQVIVELTKACTIVRENPRH